MKILTKFKLFENLNAPISIENFLQNIGIPQNKIESVATWWSQNRSHIKIHYFDFKSTQPICGVFLGVDEIAINAKLRIPPHVKLFLSLHESRHCDQHAEGILMPGYWETVVAGNKQEFLQAYAELERDANDFAIESMRQCGFSQEMDRESQMLRGNERAGEMVFKMMSDDINKLRPTDFIDLLKKQIL
jgi:hypothetical protein